MIDKFGRMVNGYPLWAWMQLLVELHPVLFGPTGEPYRLPDFTDTNTPWIFSL